MSPLERLGLTRDQVLNTLRPGVTSVPAKVQKKIPKPPKKVGRGGPRKDRLFHPKLTADQVRELRRRYDAGDRVVDIAKEIGCSIASVTHIGSRQTRLDVV